MDVLLLERAQRPGFWQSVTGSLDEPDEPFEAAAARELREETGIQANDGRLRRWNVAYTFEIYRAMAPPLRARRDPQHRAPVQPGARAAGAGDARAAGAHRVRLAAVARSGAQVLFLVQPRRDPDGRRRAARRGLRDRRQQLAQPRTSSPARRTCANARSGTRRSMPRSMRPACATRRRLA